MRQQRLQRQSSDLDPKLSKVNYAICMAPSVSGSVFIYKPKSQTCPNNVPTRRVLSPQKSNHIEKFCWMRSYYAFYLFAVTHYADWMTSITTTFTEAEVKASLIPEVVSLCKL